MRRSVVALALLVLAACGDEAADPSPPATQDPAITAENAILTLSELPVGWEAVPEREELESRGELSAECNIYDLDITFPGAIATAESEPFEGLRDQQVQTFAAVYATADQAQPVIDGVAALVDRCGDEFKQVLREAAEDELEALGISLGFLGNIDVSLETRLGGPANDASDGYRVRVDVSAVGQSQSFTVDYRVLRTGRVVAASQYAIFGEVDEAEETVIEEALLESSRSAER